MTPEVLSGFESALMSTRSEKDQRNHIKKLLFNSGDLLKHTSATPQSTGQLSVLGI